MFDFLGQWRWRETWFLAVHPWIELVKSHVGAIYRTTQQGFYEAAEQQRHAMVATKPGSAQPILPTEPAGRKQTTSSTILPLWVSRPDFQDCSWAFFFTLSTFYLTGSDFTAYSYSISIIHRYLEQFPAGNLILLIPLDISFLKWSLFKYININFLSFSGGVLVPAGILLRDGRVP